jgi:molybdenum cofactor biosynthesis enzyme MoaA
VLKTLEAAEASNLQAVKLNVVVIKDLNDSEIPAFVELTKEKNLSVRFIEFMPFNGNSFSIVSSPCSLLQVIVGTRRKWCRPPYCWIICKNFIRQLRKQPMN